MLIEEALFSRLSGHVGMAALVDDRIYPQVLPQGVIFPAVTYAKTKGERVQAMGGNPGIARVTFRVAAWSEVYADAKNVSAQVRDALERWSGTEAGVTVLHSFLSDELDDYDADTQRHQAAVDVDIIHKE